MDEELEELLVLPQYAESLKAQHIQQFQDCKIYVQTVWRTLAECMTRVISNITQAISAVVEICTSARLVSVPVLAPQHPHLSPQVRRYLAVKRRAILRTRRYDTCRVRGFPCVACR